MKCSYSKALGGVSYCFVCHDIAFEVWADYKGIGHYIEILANRSCAHCHNTRRRDEEKMVQCGRLDNYSYSGLLAVSRNLRYLSLMFLSLFLRGKKNTSIFYFMVLTEVGRLLPLRQERSCEHFE